MPRRKIETIDSHTTDIADSWARERPELDQDSLLHLIYLMRAGRVLDRNYDSYTRRVFGISGADMRVIFALRRAGAPYARRPTDLYRALLVTSGAITKQVDRLAKLGFVRRRPDRANGGGFQVELTDKGLDAADRAIKAVADSVFLRDGHNPLTARERATLIALCSKLLSNLEQPEDDAPED